jgi:hypothetical protein
MRHKLIDTSRACFLTEIAERVYGVDPLDSSRTRTNVNARAAISTILISEEERYESVAAFFNKNYASIHHIVKKHPELMEYDRQYRDKFNLFLVEINKPINKEDYAINEIRGQVFGINNKLAGMNYDEERIKGFWKEVIDLKPFKSKSNF